MALKRKRLVVIGLLVAVVLAAVCIQHFRARRAVEAYKRELISRGERLDLGEWMPPVPIEENGAPGFFADVPVLDLDGSLVPAYVIGPGHARVAWKQEALIEFRFSEAPGDLWPEARRAVAAAADARARMLGELRKPVFPVLFDPSDRAHPPLRHLRAMKDAGQFFSTSSVMHFRDGEFEKGLEDVMAGMSLAARVGDEPWMISQLIRHALISVALASTWEALHHDGWTGEQLDALQGAWEELEVLSGIEPALATERALAVEILDQMRSSYAGAQERAPLYFGVLPPEHRGHRGRLFRLWRYPGYKLWSLWWSYEEEMEMLRFSQNAINAARAAHAAGSFQPLFAREPEEEYWIHRIDFDSVRSLYRALQYDLRTTFVERACLAQTQAGMAVAAIALERFRRHHGRHPRNLAELEPEFVQSIPRDGFDGNILRYRLRDDGSYLLYSIGRNRMNNGGVPSASWGGSSLATPADWVWPRAATPEEVAAYEAGIISRHSEEFGTSWEE